MLETHPFGSFVPPHAKYLILGSFTTKEAFDPQKKADYKWFYANGGRNQFWPILEEIYGVNLQTRKDMERLLTKLNIAVADIIYQCERKKGSNLDVNLVNIVYAVTEITRVLKTNTIIQIFFTSRFVETKFRQLFKAYLHLHPALKLTTLPSPSPRYAQLTKTEKMKIYKQLLSDVSFIK